MNTIWKGLTAVCKALHGVGAVLLVGCTALSFVAVLARYVVGRAFTWSDETTVILMLWFVYLSQPLIECRGEQLNLSALVDILPSGVNKVLEVIRSLYLIGLLGFIGYAGVNMAIRNFGLGTKTVSVGFPTWLNNSLLAGVLLLIAVIRLLDIIRLIIERFHPGLPDDVQSEWGGKAP